MLLFVITEPHITDRPPSWDPDAMCVLAMCRDLALSRLDPILDPDPVVLCVFGVSSLSPTRCLDSVIGSGPCAGGGVQCVLLTEVCSDPTCCAVITGLLPSGPRGGLLSGQRLHRGTAAHAGDNNHAHAHAHARRHRHRHTHTHTDQKPTTQGKT